MKFIFVALFMSFSAFANDIINIADGSAAVCKSKADVLRYETSAVYRPVSFVRGEETATLTVEFLRCVQSGDDFKFVRDDKVERRKVTVKAGPFSTQDMTVEIKRTEIAGVSYSSKGRVYNRSEMKKNSNDTYSQTMPIELTNFEANRNGDRFFEMTVSFKVKVTDVETGKVIDSKLEHLGSFKIFVK